MYGPVMGILGAATNNICWSMCVRLCVSECECVCVCVQSHGQGENKTNGTSSRRCLQRTRFFSTPTRLSLSLFQRSALSASTAQVAASEKETKKERRYRSAFSLRLSPMATLPPFSLPFLRLCLCLLPRCGPAMRPLSYTAAMHHVAYRPTADASCRQPFCLWLARVPTSLSLRRLRPPPLSRVSPRVCAALHNAPMLSPPVPFSPSLVLPHSPASPLCPSPLPW